VRGAFNENGQDHDPQIKAMLSDLRSRDIDSTIAEYMVPEADGYERLYVSLANGTCSNIASGMSPDDVVSKIESQIYADSFSDFNPFLHLAIFAIVNDALDYVCPAMKNGASTTSTLATATTSSTTTRRPPTTTLKYSLLCANGDEVAQLATEQFDIAICGLNAGPSSAYYYGFKRSTAGSLQVHVCSLNDYVWRATNNGYVYILDLAPNSSPSITVYDPQDSVILYEEAVIRGDGYLDYEYTYGLSAASYNHC